MVLRRRLANFMVCAALVAACNGAASTGTEQPPGSPASAASQSPAPSLATSAMGDPDASPGVDSAVPPDDAAIPPVDAAPEAGGCPLPDVPACLKANYSDAACSLYASLSTPYGCTNDIGNGCTPLSSGTGWCCPMPVAASGCVPDDHGCVNNGEAACGRTRGCVTTGPGCRKFVNANAWCCPPP